MNVTTTHPKITPAEAIGIALTIDPGRNGIVGPESGAVKLVLEAIERAGWQIVPREDKPALFTRETLALMRAEAWRGAAEIAARLNWPKERVERVGRAHGISFMIEPAAVPPAPMEPAPSPSPQKPVRLLAKQTGELPKWRPAAEHEYKLINFVPALRIVGIGAHNVALTAKQWLIFRAVFDRPGINTTQLAKVADCVAEGVSSHINVMNGRLHATSFAIRGRHNFGYRLMRRASS